MRCSVWGRAHYAMCGRESPIMTDLFGQPRSFCRLTIQPMRLGLHRQQQRRQHDKAGNPAHHTEQERHFIAILQNGPTDRQYRCPDGQVDHEFHTEDARAPLIRHIA